MVKLRLTRLGRKKAPFYRIAAMEALTKRDGKAIAYLGSYNPLVEENGVVLNEEEIIRFLKNGAQPTRTVKNILVKSGVWAKFEEAKKNN
ncbi:MAG: small subunit ribosomal protein [Fusobacteriaceae bacterium]|jgi:small subunit ribosomal protein S16|nr:ribosomal protein [Fusobacteriales bacterium]MDN5303485.1 small subunit ribosomal protein [Fusobacteriaceae bacterium]